MDNWSRGKDFTERNGVGGDNGRIMMLEEIMEERGATGQGIKESFMEAGCY